MILSVSRRTDIPNYYSEWFYNRIKEGFLLVRNPMNAHQISRIEVSPQTVDCIVFWTKNPERMLGRLEELEEFQYYFQFTLTGYGKDVEPNIPNKRNNLITTFKRLSEKIGNERVIWRYDPILINETYTVEYHLRAFAEIAEGLNHYTRKVVISFVDMYAKIQRNARDINIQALTMEQEIEIAKGMAKIAEENGMRIETCAEQIELKNLGIQHGSCVDKMLIEKLIGCKLRVEKDRNQRKACGCYESIDVGTYNTCLNGCKYCYANFSDERVQKSISAYDVNSPLLCSAVGVDDRITERKVGLCKEQQLRLFDEV